MAKGDSNQGQAAVSMPSGGFGMPPSAPGVSGYGMSSLGPTMGLLQALFGGGNNMRGNMGSNMGGSPMMGGNSMMGGLFRSMMNPGFDFNTPISGPGRMPYGNPNMGGGMGGSPFARFGTPGVGMPRMNMGQQGMP